MARRFLIPLFLGSLLTAIACASPDPAGTSEPIDTDVEKILGENFLRVLREVTGS